MNDPIDRLFRDFDDGRISRRDLLRALGLAALAVPVAAFAQGGAGRGNRAPGDTTHAPAPFDATGWKTVWLDHITYQCTDYKKAAAFYSAVMGWKVRNDDGKRVVMDMGDVGGIIMTNGYVAPPPPPAPTGNDSAGRGRGGQARPPRMAAITNFCWGIDPWNTAKVEAELKKRGLNPVAEHAGDFQSSIGAIRMARHPAGRAWSNTRPTSQAPRECSFLRRVSCFHPQHRLGRHFGWLLDCRRPP